MTLNVLERHTSPDGKLTFMVAMEGEDVIVGFECRGLFDWHTHGDILAFGTELLPEQAARSFVNNLLDDKILIVVSQTDEEKKVWATYDPASDLNFRSENEVLDFRFWSGNEVYRGREVLTRGVEWIDFCGAGYDEGRIDIMNNHVIIFMPLLNEGTIVSRPVQAQQLNGDVFFILGPVPEEEEWAFQPGTKVQCITKMDDSGSLNLIADKAC